MLIIRRASDSSSGWNWNEIPAIFPVDQSTEWKKGNLASVVDIICVRACLRVREGVSWKSSWVISQALALFICLSLDLLSGSESF